MKIKTTVTDCYEKAREELKQGNNYFNYLFLKYQKDAIASKPEILAAAEKLSRNDDEQSLNINTRNPYTILKLRKLFKTE